MPEYVTISCPEELLPQVVGELLSFTYNADAVNVVHGPEGRVIHVHPEVADAWFLKHNPPTPEPAPEPVPEPTREQVQEAAPVSAPEPVLPTKAPAVASPASKPSAKKTTSA